MAIGTALALAGMGMTAAGTLQGAGASRAAARNAEAIGAYNQAVAEQDARALEMRTTFDQIRQARQGQYVLGALRARAGASGAMTSEGAPLHQVADAAAELALENALIGYEGMTQAQRTRTQGALARTGARMEAQRYRSQATATYLSGASSLLGQFGSAYNNGMFGGGGGTPSSTPS